MGVEQLEQAFLVAVALVPLPDAGDLGDLVGAHSGDRGQAGTPGDLGSGASDGTADRALDPAPPTRRRDRSGRRGPALTFAAPSRSVDVDDLGVDGHHAHAVLVRLARLGLALEAAHREADAGEHPGHEARECGLRDAEHRGQRDTRDHLGSGAHVLKGLPQGLADHLDGLVELGQQPLQCLVVGLEDHRAAFFVPPRHELGLDRGEAGLQRRLGQLDLGGEVPPGPVLKSFQIASMSAIRFETAGNTRLRKALNSEKVIAPKARSE